jgi:hypothetical protein
MKLTTVCPNKIEFEIDDIDLAVMPAKVKWDKANQILFFLVKDKIKKKSKRILLKRYIMAADDDQLVHLIDSNELNLKRSNLKIVSKSQAASQTTRALGITGHRGISYQESQSCFKAKITIHRFNYGKSFSTKKLGYDQALQAAVDWIEEIKKNHS